jgi:hypothetical protein
VISGFQDDPFFELKVAKCNDPACAGANETINTVDNAGPGGAYTSIAIGDDGNPVISYQASGDLKVARCDDPACAPGGNAISAVDTGGDVGYYTSIATGIDGNPVVSYWDFTNTALKLARPPAA